MSKRAATWQELLEAVERKLDIADYHANQLARELDELRNYAGPGVPPIEVQAHFEGVVVSLMAAVDQVVKAVNSGLGRPLCEEDSREEAGKAIVSAVPDVATWYCHPLQQDLRDLRVLMVHYSYEKKRDGTRGWFVKEPAGTKYQGSRELVDYAKAAVQYFERLRDFIPQIQEYLSEQTAEQQRVATRRAT